MQDQITVCPAEIPANDLAARVDEPPSQAPAAITVAVLRAARAACGTRFVVRTGDSLDLASGIEAGAYVPWEVPAPQLEALVQALGPELGEMLWTASMCDLLLVNVLGGDLESAGIVATDVLSSPAERGLARALLRWAVQGVGLAIPPLLTDAERALLHVKATELAVRDGESAWVAAELLELFASSSSPAAC